MCEHSIRLHAYVTKYSLLFMVAVRAAAAHYTGWALSLTPCIFRCTGEHVGQSIRFVGCVSRCLKLAEYPDVCAPNHHITNTKSGVLGLISTNGNFGPGSLSSLLRTVHPDRQRWLMRRARCWLICRARRVCGGSSATGRTDPVYGQPLSLLAY